ncbi:hypothetical protein OFN18_23385, partial [Escherichia coli]|nr:hypothetical protein [Escherichia coli]
EWVHVQLHQQKGMISLSPPTICNSAVIDDTVEAREAMLEANPPLRDWYSADDGKFTVFYLKNMQAVLYSFTGDPEILDN